MGEGARRSKIRDTAGWRAYVRHRYAILFYSLLLMLVIIPVASALGVLEKAIRLLLGASLLAAVMPTATKRMRHLLVVSVVAIILAGLGAERGYLPFAPGFVAAAYGVIGLLAAAAAMRFAISSKGVSYETIYAALGAYLLAGLFFGQLYFSIENIWPGSLGGPDEFTQADAVYFSFVTLASLGYGDFLPRSEIARGVAIFEVVGGQLYIAVLVARLVGLFRDTSEAE